MAELKTRKNDRSVDGFIASLDDERKRRASHTLVALMRDITGSEPSMWGENIVGFGKYRFKYASGREIDWMLTGFSPRKRALSIYVMTGFDGQDEIMGALGKHKTGKSCLYVNKLDDIDMDALRRLLEASVSRLVEKYGPAQPAGASGNARID